MVKIQNTGFHKEYDYVVIFARYNNKWVYARHKERQTYETAGGHVEPGEAASDAARRELFEETGAVISEIFPVFDYSVHQNGSYTTGQVFFARASELLKLPDFEMAEIILHDTYPENLTYPHILPVLFDHIINEYGEINAE